RRLGPSPSSQAAISESRSAVPHKSGSQARLKLFGGRRECNERICRARRSLQRGLPQVDRRGKASRGTRMVGEKTFRSSYGRLRHVIRFTRLTRGSNDG